VAELLDHLVAAGKGRTGRELADGCLEGFRHDRRMVLGRGELGPAITAELLGLGVLGVTFRTLDGHGRPLLSCMAGD
jgi:hypothetical protein